MDTYWTSNTGSAESFWEHEWGKHGTCVSTLEPDCYTDHRPTQEVPDYFRRTVSLFKSLPSYEWLKAAGIEPSSSSSYSANDIQTVLSKKHGGKRVYLGCSGSDLNEIWYYFNVRGSVQTGEFVPADPDGSEGTCPDSGIKYLPKGSSGGGGSNSSSSASSAPSSTPVSSSTAPSSTATGAPFSGKGNLNVVTSGSKKGCIISHGTWYTTGSCATFTSTSSSNSSSGFTLRSSKGDCAVDSQGEFICGSDVSQATGFSAEGSNLVYDGSTTFYADSVPTGNEQGTVYMGGSEGSHSVSLGVEWQNA